MKSRIYINSIVRNATLINLFLIFFSSNYYSQNLSYLKTYNDIAPDNWYMRFPCIDTLNQNAYIHSGFLQKLNASFPDTFASATNFFSKNSVNGNIQWIKAYKVNEGITTLNNFCILQNKEIITCGDYGHPVYFNKYGGLLAKLDSSGNVIWSKQVPKVLFTSVSSLKNNSFVFVGKDTVYPNCSNIIGKVTSAGNILWSKRIDDAFLSTQNGIKLIENTNGDILLVGSRLISSVREGVAILLDSLGNKKNEIILSSGGSVYTIFNSVCLDKSNGYLIVGLGPTSITNQFGPLIIRTDENLNIKWKKHYFTTNLPSEFIDVSSINNNNYLLLTEPEGHGINPAMYLQRFGFATIDSNGVFSKNFLISKDSINHMPRNFKFMNNGKIIFTGTSRAIFYGLTDTVSTGFCGYKNIAYTACFPTTVFKTGLQVTPFSLVSSNINLFASPFTQVLEIDDCQIPLSINEDDEEDELKIFPIPTNNTLFIKSSENESDISNADLYDNFGQKIKTTLFRQDLKLTRLIFNTNPGLYYLQVSFSNGVIKTKKVLVN